MSRNAWKHLMGSHKRKTIRREKAHTRLSKAIEGYKNKSTHPSTTLPEIDGQDEMNWYKDKLSKALVEMENLNSKLLH